VQPGTRVVSGWREILDDASVPIVVELAGGTEGPCSSFERREQEKARNHSKQGAAFRHGRELFALASEKALS